MKSQNKLLPIMAIAASILSSCTDEHISVQSPYGDTNSVLVDVPDMSDVDVSSRDLKIFADVNSYVFGTPATKATSTPEYLEDFLDRSKARSLDLGEKTITEIPFKSELSDETASVNFSYPEFYNQDAVSAVKIALVDWTDNATLEHEIYVVTMIPYADFCSDSANDDFTFISSLGSFRGLLLFSEPDGTYVSSYEYLEGEFLELKANNPEKYEDTGIAGRAYISFPSTIPSETKAFAVRAEVQYEVLICLDLLCCPAVCGASAGGGTIIYLTDRGASASAMLRCVGQYGSNSTYSYGGGGGSSKSSNGTSLRDLSQNKGAPESVAKIQNKFSGNAKYVEKAKAAMESHYKSFSLAKGLMDALGAYSSNITSIELQVTIVSTEGTSTHALTTPLGDGKYRIDIQICEEAPDGVYSSALFEELFHVYQKSQDPSWSTGDLEFEAKVYISLLDDQASKNGLYSGMREEYRDVFLKYYNDPTEENFTAAKNTLPFVGYPSEKYPVSSGWNSDKRIIHLKSFSK